MSANRTIPPDLKKSWKKQRRVAFYTGLAISLSFLPATALVLFFIFNLQPEGANVKRYESFSVTNGTITKIEDSGAYRSYTYSFKKPNTANTLTESMTIKLSDNPGIGYKMNDTVPIQYTGARSGIDKVKLPKFSDLPAAHPKSSTTGMYGVVFVMALVFTLPLFVFGWIITIFARLPAERKIKIHKKGILVEGKITYIGDMMGKMVVAYEFIPQNGNMLFKAQKTVTNMDIIANKHIGDPITIAYLPKRPDKNTIFEISGEAA